MATFNHDRRPTSSGYPFRGTNQLKATCLSDLLRLESVKKYSRSIAFIRRALQPYKGRLPFLPSVEPETVQFDLSVRNSAPPTIKSLTLKGLNLLKKNEEADEGFNRAWKLSFVSFTGEELKEKLADAWRIPIDRITIKCSQKIEPETEYRLSKGTSILWPD